MLSQLDNLWLHFLVYSIASVLNRTRNDQRCPGLIDQYAVHLIYNGIVNLSLHQRLQAKLHVITQVVKPELVVCSVSDVSIIGFLALRVVQSVDNGSHRQAQKTVDAAHPFCVSPG